MNAEKERLKDAAWRKWGPYVSNRQWGTVREDYSAGGDAWNYTTHDMARSKAFRWGEEGIGGICDKEQQLCFAAAFWNHNDPFIKERFFGLSNQQGNHGEDVKDIYYYTDAAPSHAYLKMQYLYPQQKFPYEQLIAENAKRNKEETEFELTDTGIFNNNCYFNICIEYAKVTTNDILIQITVQNKGTEKSPLTVLPTIWFRNTWLPLAQKDKPLLFASGANLVKAEHAILGNYFLYCQNTDDLLFCENETNNKRLYNYTDDNRFYKDGINNYIVNAENTVNPDRGGTKATAVYQLDVNPGEEIKIRLRLCNQQIENAFEIFDETFAQRIKETNEFYDSLQQNISDNELKNIQRQAWAGLIWNKQFYFYDVHTWLNGDIGSLPPPPQRKKGRNTNWQHFSAADIISMPDTWEYPWFATWDLALQCIAFANIDIGFAKEQLLLLTHERYMHSMGQLPAYEWAFDEVNPPVHAWAALYVYETEKKLNVATADKKFLTIMFQKLLINYTWWLNRKDAEGNNIFEGGFLGLDNIEVFNREMPLPTGGILQQADSTGWMAMYSLNMYRMALILAQDNEAYLDIAGNFIEHFLHIAGAIKNSGTTNTGLWDDADGFFYDAIAFTEKDNYPLKIRSLVGLIPLLAIEVWEDGIPDNKKILSNKLDWFIKNRPDLVEQVSRWNEPGKNNSCTFSLIRGHRLKAILHRMLDENEFLGPYGIRSISKVYEQHPYKVTAEGTDYEVKYTPGESNNAMFGGNSNWRGPVWMPVNFLIIESLLKFYKYYGDDFTVEFPTGSQNYHSLKFIAENLRSRLISLYKQQETKLAVYNNDDFLQSRPGDLLFFEYFNGDNGRGLGASHQTGWTALLANLIKAM
ncbi:MAG TPA: glucosidase [Ferruginibacter sp.]|nr:glucosidase [Ferruginibacter sp.]